MKNSFSDVSFSNFKPCNWTIHYRYAFDVLNPDVKVESAGFSCISPSPLDAINRLIEYMCSQRDILRWQIEDISGSKV